MGRVEDEMKLDRFVDEPPRWPEDRPTPFEESAGTPQWQKPKPQVRDAQA